MPCAANKDFECYPVAQTVVAAPNGTVYAKCSRCKKGFIVTIKHLKANPSNPDYAIHPDFPAVAKQSRQADRRTVAAAANVSQ